MDTRTPAAGRLGDGVFRLIKLYTENVVRKTSGNPDSLFGFSMTMHRQLDPICSGRLLVGAPRAKALRGQTSSITGGLYRCDMDRDDCSRVEFDNMENPKAESKQMQWMGVSVSSQGPGGKVMTCAHRYQHLNNVGTNFEFRAIIGRCYVFSQDLSINPSSNEDGGNWLFCQGRSGGHERFGSCQQGLSAIFDDEYHYFIFGAPGAYDWRGLVRLEHNNFTLLDMGFYDDGPFEVGDEDAKDPNLVPTPPNSYLGFSLDTGKRLVKQDQLTVVAGAPRANHSGAVVLLRKGPDTSKVMEKDYILEGEGLASSFGYALAVLDLNGDRWEDLVVGAPQYFEKEKEIGGAVYVYVNNQGMWDKITPVRIDGPQDSMFGLAVANLGDINQDGYHDFAVGAPNDNNGAGKVFIFHGSKLALQSKKAGQVLTAKPGVKMFGYSLASNMDLDKNSYPDLAVGSLSDEVFVYRARPVINVKKDIQLSTKEIDLTKKNCGNTFCLEVKACFSYTANPRSYSPRLTVVYSLEADAENRKKGLISRAVFIEGATKSYNSRGTVVLNSQGMVECVNRQLAIQENIKDKLSGIPIDVSVEIQDTKRKRRQSSFSQLPPVLDANVNNMVRSMVPFRKEGCGNDNICQSNLALSYRYGYMAADDISFVPLELENGIPVIKLSNQKNVALEVNVTNLNGDDAYEASMVAAFLSSLTYSEFRVPLNKHPVSCTANKNGSLVDCELGNPFKRNSEAIFYIIMGTSGISLDTNEVEVELKFETTSEQQALMAVKAKAKVAILLQLSVSGQALPSQAYFSGKVIGEEAIKTESEMGSAITHRFKIINLGKSLTEAAVLEIDWPKETADEKWLLYLMNISLSGVKQINCSPKGEINPRQKVGHNAPRSRRAAKNSLEGDKGTISRYTDEKKSQTLSCDQGAKCVKIKCPLQFTESNAVITLHSRLWNSTFIEDFSKLHHVVVTVKASLNVDSSRNTVLHNAVTEVKLTVFPERRETQTAGVAWWIIVLTILLLLLLLGLLAFLLWKRGVFGKKNKQDSADKERLTAKA
uniref:Integrin, alpha 6b n=1 Tax=Tetraodon nigroviridis TaxID=99883 RepID=H3C4H1_TETNG